MTRWSKTSYKIMVIMKKKIHCVQSVLVKMIIIKWSQASNKIIVPTQGVMTENRVKPVIK